MNPSSGLLQDLLREKKASQRTSHISEHDSVTYDRQVQSSPIGPSAASKPHSRRASGLTGPKEMGLREMEEYISKLNKQNFDLKLEIFQRRQRTDALEVKAARLDELELQNDELRQVNDDLLQELERRDLAVGEAVSLICEFEAKVARLEREQQHSVRPVTPIEDCYANPEAREYHQLLASKSTPRSPSSVKSSGVDYPGRQHGVTPSEFHHPQEKDRLLPSPSFMSDDKPSTVALRGLFQSQDKNSTANGFGPTKPSIPSLRRVGSPSSQDDFTEALDGDTFSLNPRRLSLLSESSFVSVYGQKKDKITPSSGLKDTLHSSPPGNGDASARGTSPQDGRVRQWIEHRDHPASPSNQSTTSARPDAFSSIGEILKSDQPSRRDLPQASPTHPSGRHQRQNVERYAKPDTKPSFAGPVFGPNALPPTPGTMSSATLGGRSSNHSIIAEKSLNDGISRPSTRHTSEVPHKHSPGSSDDMRSLRDDRAKIGPQSIFDNDTDFDVSDEDNHPAYRDPFIQSNQVLRSKSQARPLIGESVKASHVLGANGTQRPRLGKNVTESMVNGDNIETIRRARTISYPSPGRTHQHAGQTVSDSPVQALARSSGGREPSAQQATIGSTSKPTLPRSLSSYSKLSQPTAPPPSQTFTSRLFRRNPSSTLPTSAQPESTSSPESKIRPPRPTSLYARTTSNPPPPSLGAPLKAPRPSCPGTSGTPDMTGLKTRRLSGSIASNVVGKGMNGDAVGSFGASNEEQQVQGPPQQQPQNKRLSVGAIGRSASLRIKEGFGRKK
ncbi:MAG: hypothetical protein Q9205_005852 [Flavoplaca limonia]